MGNQQSREQKPVFYPEAPPTAVPKPVLDDPWRRANRGSRDDLLNSIRAYRPPEGVGRLRVLLYGPVGVGKSSLINSVQTALHGQAAILTASSSKVNSKSFTVKFETHKFLKLEGEDCFPFVITDTMGLEPGPGGVLPEDIILAMEGHIKEGYTFNQSSALSKTDHYYRKDPTLQDQVHLLVCVLSANSPGIHPNIVSKINHIRKAARDLKIPQMAVITNIDIVCKEMEDDLKNVYKSKYLQGKMKNLSTSVGIPLNYMFPVKNYSQGNTECDEDMDTLLLTALDHMTGYGNVFIKTTKASMNSMATLS